MTIQSDSQQQKKSTYQIVDFAIPADHRVKLKKSKKRDTYQDIASEQRTLWNMKVTVIPIVPVRSVESPKDWYGNWRTCK